MRQERRQTDDLREENRALREALEVLLEEMDARQYAVDTDRVRDRLPTDEIAPPWERDGYDVKQEWIEENRGGPE